MADLYEVIADYQILHQQGQCPRSTVIICGDKCCLTIRTKEAQKRIRRPRRVNRIRPCGRYSKSIEILLTSGVDFSLNLRTVDLQFLWRLATPFDSSY